MKEKMKNVQQKKRYFWYALAGPGWKLAPKISSFTGAASSRYPSRERSHIPPLGKNKSASHMPWGYELIVPRTVVFLFLSKLLWQTMINDRRSQIPQIHSETQGAWRRCHSNCATGRGREGQQKNTKRRRLSAVILWMKEVRLTSWGW